MGIQLDKVKEFLDQLGHFGVFGLHEMYKFDPSSVTSLLDDPSEPDAVRLNKFLKKNPPKTIYRNPRLSTVECTEKEQNLIDHIFHKGLDLPGSKTNLYGNLEYFSNFFIDMFFGNLTEVNDHLKSLPENELYKALERREGYCQYSPIFAPIVGLRMVNIENSRFLTADEKKKVRFMFPGNNENKHVKIVRELIKLGAEVNAHDVHGFTPLHHAIEMRDEHMVEVLLINNANPNAVSRTNEMPSAYMLVPETESELKIVDLMMKHNAKINHSHERLEIRMSLEDLGCIDLIIRAREAYPLEKNVCENCLEDAVKMCGGCWHAQYCSTECQKDDWKLHKHTCKKYKMIKK